MFFHIRLTVAAAALFAAGFAFAQPMQTEEEAEEAAPEAEEAAPAEEGVEDAAPAPPAPPAAAPGAPGAALPPVPAVQPQAPAGQKPPEKKSAMDFKPRFLLFGQADVASPDAKLDESSASAGIGLGYESMSFNARIMLRKGTKQEVGAYTDDEGNVVAGHESDYGYTILDPSATDYSYFGEVAWYPFKLAPKSMLRPLGGFRLYTMASTVRWNYPNADDTEVESVEVTPFVAGLCFSTYTRAHVPSQIASMYGHGCWVFRNIGGDYADGDEDSLNRRSTILSTRKVMFQGPELEVGFRLGNLSLGAKIAWTTEDINGLSSFRFTPFISGSMPISFPLESDDSDKESEAKN